MVRSRKDQTMRRLRNGERGERERAFCEDAGSSMAVKSRGQYEDRRD